MSTAGLSEQLSAGLSALFSGPPRPDMTGQLLNYLELLIRWNDSYNLTAIRDPQQMVTRHLLDSLSVMPWIDEGPLLDAGTGAGLPGIPLAIMRPKLHVTLLDSTGKKIRFLNHVARSLALKNIHPVQERLENWTTEETPSRIISRAFADLDSFARACRHLMGEKTRLLAMKGKYPVGELNKLPAWLKIDSIEKLTVPGLQEDRHLVIMSLIQ
jgi:16S rRNA (guanine527-N7)-methyltransferase